MSRQSDRGRACRIAAAAVFGDALCSLLQFAAATVTREYYINDAGAHGRLAGAFGFPQYREALGEISGAFPKALSRRLPEAGRAGAGAEHGDRLRAMREAMAAHRAGQGDRDDDGRDQGDLAAPQHPSRRILFRTFADRVCNNKVARDHRLPALARRYLMKAGWPPRQRQAVEITRTASTLSRATAYGDDVDRPLIKSDSSYTLFRVRTSPTTATSSARFTDLSSAPIMAAISSACRQR